MTVVPKTSVSLLICCAVTGAEMTEACGENLLREPSDWQTGAVSTKAELPKHIQVCERTSLDAGTLRQR